MKRLALLTGVLGLALGAVGGALAASLLHPAVDDSAISNASKVILITAPVELKPVREHYVVSGVVEGPTAVSLALRGDVGLDIVTAHAKTPGDTMSYGSLVAEISGRPVVALPVSVPLYRDLMKGDKGEDVRALEQVLIDLGLRSGSPTGVFDGATITATRALFTAHGYDLPTEGRTYYLPLSWTLGLQGSPVRVVEALPVGSTVDGEHPVAKIAQGATTVQSRVDMLQARVFIQDASVNIVVSGGAPFAGTVASVSEFKEAGASVPAGYDITINVSDEVAAGLVAGMSATVSDTDTVELGLAVPLTAIRRDDVGTYVLVTDQSSTAGSTTGPSESASPTNSSVGPARVDVSVVGQASGYAILQENPALSVGILVVVSGG